MKIETLELVFENCETIIFKGEDIKYLNISVKEKKFIKHKADINLNTFYILSELFLELNKSANKEYYPFDINDEKYKTTKFDRIKDCRDITQIYIEYDNGKEDIFYIDFKDDDDFINNNQNVKKDKDENLIIFIKDEERRKNGNN